MELGVQLVIMVVFGGICAAIAPGRGRSAVGWFFIGFIFGCLGLIVLMVIPDLKVLEERHRRLAGENRRLREMVRKDRTVADQRYGETLRRIGVHDRALGLDTGNDPLPLAGGAGYPDPPPLPSDVATDVKLVEWHYISESGQRGPVAFGTLKTLWRAGQLRPEFLVWSDGMEEWLPVKDVRGMEAALND